MNMIELTGADIGSPVLKGSAAKVADGYDIVAGGEDIWLSNDQCHFAYLKHTGNFEFTVRLESLELVHPYTKSGIMARPDLDADGQHIFFFAFPDNRERNHNNGGYEFQSRDQKGTDCQAVYPPDYTTEPPMFPVSYPDTWMKLIRASDTFESYYSNNGTDWMLYNRHQLALDTNLLVGLAVTSHESNQTALAKFREIECK